MTSILIIIPIKPRIHPELAYRAVNNAAAIPEANPDLNVVIMFDYRKEGKQEGDNRVWSKVARIRNKAIDSVRMSNFDYVMFIDADIIKYDPELPSQLIKANPYGISAPMVFCDKQTAHGGGEKFYDRAAFIEKGASHIEPTMVTPWIDGRNFREEYPYFGGYKENAAVEVDCVGCVYTIPASVLFVTDFDGRRIRYDNHQAFTDHFPICEFVRDNGHSVTVHTGLSVWHAYLPEFGEEWH